MTATACALLRHELVPRWVGDVLAAWCLDCDCIHFQDDRAPSRRAGGSPALVSPSPRAAVVAFHGRSLSG